MHGPYSAPGIWSSKWVRFGHLCVRNAVPKMRPFFATGRIQKDSLRCQIVVRQGSKTISSKGRQTGAQPTRSRQTKTKSRSTGMAPTSWTPLSGVSCTLPYLWGLPAALAHLARTRRRRLHWHHAITPWKCPARTVQ